MHFVTQKRARVSIGICVPIGLAVPRMSVPAIGHCPTLADEGHSIRIPGVGLRMQGMKTSIFIEVAGAAHYLPAYAGNLDIMTSAALRTAERIAEHMLSAKAA